MEDNKDFISIAAMLFCCDWSSSKRVYFISSLRKGIPPLVIFSFFSFFTTLYIFYDHETKVQEYLCSRLEVFLICPGG